MKPHLVSVAALVALLAGCGWRSSHQAASARPALHASSCLNPSTVYLSEVAHGEAFGESAAWLSLSLLGGVSSPDAVNSGRLVEAVVADGPIWSVEDLWLTPKDAARLQAFARSHPTSMALTVQACFVGRRQVALRRIAVAQGPPAQRATQLVQGIEMAGPKSVAPGDTLFVVLSKGSMYDMVYRWGLPGGPGGEVWYAYDQTRDLLYRLPIPVLASADAQDVFEFTVPQDAAPGSYFLALLRPPMPRSPGAKPGEPGFGFMNGINPGGFTFEVEAR